MNHIVDIYTSDKDDYAIIEIEPPLDEAEMARFYSTQRPACLPWHFQRLKNSFRIAGWGETGMLQFYRQFSIIMFAFLMISIILKQLPGI